MVMPELLSPDSFKCIWEQVNETIEKKRDIDKLELKEIKQEIRQREAVIEKKAIQSARSGFALFMVEELETLKRELNPLKKRKQHLETEIAKLKRVTVAELQELLSSLKREWEQAESGSQQRTVIHKLLHNIIITNETVSVFIHYHTLTANPVDLKIEVASVKRDLLFKIWKRHPASENRSNIETEEAKN